MAPVNNDGRLQVFAFEIRRQFFLCFLIGIIFAKQRAIGLYGHRPSFGGSDGNTIGIFFIYLPFRLVPEQRHELFGAEGCFARTS